jgi:hypothetical protein
MNPRWFSLTRSRRHCARLGADHYEDGRGGDLLTLAGPDVLERQGFQAALAVAVATRVRKPDSDAGGRLQLGDEVAGHAGGQRLARMSSVTPGTNLARCRAA